MGLSHGFYSTVKSLFPKASIIIDRFHYVRLLNDSLKNCRLDTCSKLSNKALTKSIKRNLHLFDKYKKELNDKYQWYDRHLKRQLHLKVIYSISLSKMVQTYFTNHIKYIRRC